MNPLYRLLEIPLFLGFLFFGLNFIYQLYMHALNSVCERNSKWWIKNGNGVYAVLSVIAALACLTTAIFIQNNS